MTRCTYSSLALLTFLSACGTDPGVTSPDAASVPDAETVVLDDAGFGPMQVWTGYAELTTFPSGSDAITLSFASDAAGKVKGTIVFGALPPPPKATEPGVRYPPEGYSGVSQSFPVEGFVYSMVSGTFQAGRLRFTIELNELFKDWCALQAPRPWENADCRPPVIQTLVQTTHPLDTQAIRYERVGTTESGESIFYGYNSWAYALCESGNREGVCTCGPSGCVFHLFDIPVPTYDILFTKDSGSGVTTEALGSFLPTTTLRFTKANH